MSLWIVTPTYNERDNLINHTERLLALPDVEILVVDDNSPDGTGALADELSAKNNRIHVLHRPGKGGLGSAYRDGFRFALEQGATTIIQLDADGSHDTALIPLMLQRLEQADLVLASRYVRGGSMGIQWYRQVISSMGNYYIRALLGWGIHDWSTGFKAWRGSFVGQLLQEPTSGKGYAWLMEMTWLARRRGARIVEVPLKFLERRAGVSKFSWAIAVEDLRLAWQLHRRG